ncbi:MAG TPA: SRPBCC domain-containing protein [Micromonosporaceae bacterium]|jgi:hypothetical protein
MKAFHASSVIAATPEQVWAVLVDGRHWTDWDSAVVRFDGTIAAGQKVTVRPEVNPGRAFPVTVVEFDPGKRMVWRGGMPLGLFTGTRTYTLAGQPDGMVRFDMEEHYSGPLATLITKSIPDLTDSFTRFANGLKQRVESTR